MRVLLCRPCTTVVTMSEFVYAFTTGGNWSITNRPITATSSTPRVTRETGEWLDHVQGIPTCVPVPVDCPVDDQHVFVPRATARIVANTEAPPLQTGQCLQLFTQGPCSKGIVLRRIESDDVSVWSDFPASEAVRGLPVLLEPSGPCHRGSRRSRNNQCPLS